ncbi:MAG: MBL fold metallo-hydrolase [Gammaproteobacteria bacterium]|nr:MBL fold metallo-hydrolase [Gammaproteobacteria bacterium]
MKIILFKHNEFEENAYLIKEEDKVTIIDPGFNYAEINDYLQKESLVIKNILLTHGHIDHIGELELFLKDNKDINVYISEKDYPFLFDSYLNASDYFRLSKKNMKEYSNIYKVSEGFKVDGFEFYETPGHTVGSMVIKYNNYLFTGDTLFRGTIGRTDLPTGSMADMNYSLKKIADSFSKSIIILPGHYNKSTLKDELETNPLLMSVYLKTKKHKFWGRK